MGRTVGTANREPEYLLKIVTKYDRPALYRKMKWAREGCHLIMFYAVIWLL